MLLKAETQTGDFSELFARSSSLVYNDTEWQVSDDFFYCNLMLS